MPFGNLDPDLTAQGFKVTEFYSDYSDSSLPKLVLKTEGVVLDTIDISLDVDGTAIMCTVYASSSDPNDFTMDANSPHYDSAVESMIVLLKNLEGTDRDVTFFTKKVEYTHKMVAGNGPFLIDAIQFYGYILENLPETEGLGSLTPEEIDGSRIGFFGGIISSPPADTEQFAFIDFEPNKPEHLGKSLYLRRPDGAEFTDTIFLEDGSHGINLPDDWSLYFKDLYEAGGTHDWVIKII